MVAALVVALAATASAQEGAAAGVEITQGDVRWVISAPGEVCRQAPGEEPSCTAVPGAVGLFEAGGRVWVEVNETRALPLGGSAPVGAPATGRPATPAPAATPSTVLRVQPGKALVDAGRRQGLEPGAAVRFLGRQAVEGMDLEGSGEGREVEVVVATGIVRQLDEDRSLVELNRGGRVDVGDRAEVTPRRGLAVLAPERFGDVAEAGLTLRPLLALDTVGIALVNEVWFTWTFERPWYLDARLLPLGVGWSRDGNPISIAAVASGGYDSRWFGVGLGAGYSMLNGEPGTTDYAVRADEAGGVGEIVEAVEFKDVDGAFAIVQQARLGSRDGLNVTVRNLFLLVPSYEIVYDDACLEDYWNGEGGVVYEDCYEQKKGDSEFAFGGIAMRLAVPVGSRTDLVADWGTGDAGATWVQGGVAAWLKGNGDRGSFGAEVAAGYGQLVGEPDDETVSLYGPLVSAGLRWRL